MRLYEGYGLVLAGHDASKRQPCFALMARLYLFLPPSGKVAGYDASPADGYGYLAYDLQGRLSDVFVRVAYNRPSLQGLLPRLYVAISRM